MIKDARAEIAGARDSADVIRRDIKAFPALVADYRSLMGEIGSLSQVSEAQAAAAA